LVAGKRGREGEKMMDPDHGIWTAGPCIGLISDIPTCEELVQQMVADAEATIRGRLQAVLAPASRL
jgi:nitronate monooxygenase